MYTTLVFKVCIVSEGAVRFFRVFSRYRFVHEHTPAWELFFFSSVACVSSDWPAPAKFSSLIVTIPFFISAEWFRARCIGPLGFPLRYQKKKKRKKKKQQGTRTGRQWNANCFIAAITIKGISFGSHLLRCVWYGCTAMVYTYKYMFHLHHISPLPPPSSSPSLFMFFCFWFERQQDLWVNYVDIRMRIRIITTLYSGTQGNILRAVINIDCRMES